MAQDVFSVPVFLVVFRETLETAIIVSVLLAFVKQTLGGPHSDPAVYKKLRKQIWWGTGIGFLICMVVAAAVIGVFYTVGTNSWELNENYYEGAFCLFASIIITIMGAALLRIGKMQDKWRVKLAKALETRPVGEGTGGEKPIHGLGARFKFWLQKYAMFILPFITVLREGIEAVVFVAGVSFSAPAKSVPLAVVIGLLVGMAIGYLLYKGGSTAKLQWFLVASSCLLYLVAAGLFSRGVLGLELGHWNKVIGGEAAEFGAGPGSYDIDQSVWHVNCCSPEGEETGSVGGWGIFNAILGWTNSATYGSVISYNLYWVFVMIGFIMMRFHETKGHWPFMKPKAGKKGPARSYNDEESSDYAAHRGSQSKGVPHTTAQSTSS